MVLFCICFLPLICTKVTKISRKDIDCFFLFSVKTLLFDDLLVINSV